MWCSITEAAAGGGTGGRADHGATGPVVLVQPIAENAAGQGADPSSGDYNEEAAFLLKKRTLAFLHRVGQTP